MIQLTPDTQIMLDSLRNSVAETLERKRRLGQHAVIWQDGEPALVADEVPKPQMDDHDEQGRESH